ncbi:MAG: OadG family protein [Clostridia bacterium]|nr:OadG family protein [Clostridia bacterium]
MPEISNLFVVGLGIGVVFVGLICIVILCKIVSAFCMIGQKDKPKDTPPAPVVATNEPIQNRQEIIAAVSAAIAEELGTDISAIRILSFKKL